MKFLIVVISVLLLQACAAQLVVKSGTNLKPYSSDENRPVEGLLYYLPAVGIDFEVTRTLANCKFENGKAKLDFKSEITVAEKVTIDPSEPHLIGYENLQNGLKDIDLTVELYENATLKSVNAIVTDKTANVVENSFSLLANSVRISSGFDKETDKKHPCTEEVGKALEALPLETKKLKSKQVELNKIISDNNPEDAKKKKEIEARIKELGALITQYNSLLSWTERSMWIPTNSNDQHIFEPLDKNYVQIFFKKPERDAEANDFLSAAQDANHRISVEAKITPKVAVEIDLPKGDKNSKKHLVYRSPVPATLYLCKQVCGAIESGGLPPREILLKTHDMLLPQAGVKIALPFKNGAFEDQTLTVSFRENGSIEKFRYIDKAQFEAASGALNSLSANLLALQQELDGQELAEINAQTAMNEALKKQADSKRELIEAEQQLAAVE